MKNLLHVKPTADLSKAPELGMGFHLVDATIDGETTPRLFVLVAGRDFAEGPRDSAQTTYVALPDSHESYFSLTDLLAAAPLPLRGPLTLTRLTAVKAHHQRNVADLPNGYKPSSGAVPLLGIFRLPKAMTLYRFVASPTDPRFLAGRLLKNTYFTSRRDQRYANTGFAAVGRYALPLPMPASHVFEYRFPANTVFRVGTALPSFGQSGGGVELQLIRARKPTNATSAWRDDF